MMQTIDEQLRSTLDRLPALAGSIEEFVDAVAEQRSRPIVVHDLPTGIESESLCGLWLATDQADLVFIAPNLAGPHRDHVVMHELAHVLLDHRLGLSETLTAISPKLASRMLARTAYSDPQERQAEQLASMVLSRTQGTSRRHWAHDPSLRRAAAVFGAD